MTKFLKYLAPLLLLAVVPAVATADFISSVNLTGDVTNIVKFFNRDTFVSSTGTQKNSSDVESGDLLVSIFSATQLYWQGDNSPQWAASSGDYLLGYALFEVDQVIQSGNQVLGMTFKSPTVADPFGALNSGESMKLYTSENNWTVAGPTLTLADSIASVTQGTTTHEWATFNINALPADDFASLGISYVGSVPVLRVAAYGMSAISGDVDFLEGDYLDLGNGQADALAGIASIYANVAYGSDSPWEFISSDPIFFRAVPEPGTLTLFAGCLAIGGVIALRRRKK